MSKCCALAFNQASVIVSNMGESALLSSVAPGNELEQCVDQNGLRGKKTIGILSQADYQLLRVKKPEARESEMLTAILWQEQARFSLPMDQLVVDYVECASMSSEKRIYVTAVAKRALKNQYQILLDVGLRPTKITLPELVYAHYVQKNYAVESVVILVNYFPDAAQVLAFYRGELLATLKLPKIESTVISEACMTALTLFYHAEVKPFSAAPLWLMNGLFTIEASLLEQISGRVQWLTIDLNSNYCKTLEHLNYSTVSHAYYGMLANE